MTIVTEEVEARMAERLRARRLELGLSLQIRPRDARGRARGIALDLRDHRLADAAQFGKLSAGLSVEPLGDGPDAYQQLVANGRPVGGLAGPVPGEEGWPSGGPEGHWISYLASDDVDAAAQRAVELGGKLLLPPTDVPGMGRATVLRDADGAAFGLFTSAG